MKGFRKITGFEIKNLKEYVLDYIANNPGVQIYVGCDSQVKRKTKNIIYATTIVLVNPGRGGHVIYKREYIKKEKYNQAEIHEIINKLWEETEKIASVSLYLSTFLPKEKIIPGVDYNTNPDPKFISNKIETSAVGYLKGLGFPVVLSKPDSYASKSVADYYCRN